MFVSEVAKMMATITVAGDDDGGGGGGGGGVGGTCRIHSIIIECEPCNSPY